MGQSCCWSRARRAVCGSPSCCRVSAVGAAVLTEGSPVPSPGLCPDNKADRDRHGAVCGSHRPALLWSTRPFQLEDVMKAHCSVCVKLKVANGRPGVGGRGGRAGQAGECDKLGEMRVCLLMKEGGRKVCAVDAL